MTRRVKLIFYDDDHLNSGKDHALKIDKVTKYYIAQFEFKKFFEFLTKRTNTM